MAEQETDLRREDKMKTIRVRQYRKRKNKVVAPHTRSVGRPIEWWGVTLGDPTDPQSSPENSLVAWVCHFGADGEDLTSGDGGVSGLIHAKRITIRSVFRQYLRHWHGNIRYAQKHELPVDIETTTLLLTMQRIENGNEVDIPAVTSGNRADG
jgi:hypothetical protein